MTLTESSRKGSSFAQFRQVYCWQLKKSRVLALVYGALALLGCTIVFLCESLSLRHDYFEGILGEGMKHQEVVNSFSWDLTSSLNQLFYMVLIPLSLVFLVAFSVTAFGYMHRRRSVDLFHALPIRRTPLLLGKLAAGYTVMALVVLGNGLLSGGIGLAQGAGKHFICGWLLSGLGYQLLLLAAALVLTLFLLVASGTMVNAVLSGILLSVGWPVLCYCGSEIIRMSLPGSTLSTNLVAVTTVVPYLALFVPFLNYCPADAISSLVTDGGRYYEATSGASYSYAISPWVVIWWCVFTALLLAMAILVYRRRKSECAENHFSYPALRTVIRFLVSAAFGLGCGMVFGQLLNRNWVFFLAVLVGSAVAHGVTQIIWAKGLRRFRESLPAYGVLLASLCVFFVILATGGLGYVGRIPDPTQVENVNVELPESYYGDSMESYLGKYGGIEVWYNAKDGKEASNYLDVERLMTSETSVKTVEKMHQAIIDFYGSPYLPFRSGSEDQYDNYACTIRYRLSDGKELERTYYLPMEITDESSSETVWKLAIPEENLEKMAAVMALDEYQSYVLYYYQQPSQIATVLSDRRESEGEYMGEQALSKKQQQKLWNTFQKELKSDRFHYSVKDSSGVTGEGETSYYINLESVWQVRQWPDALKKLLADQVNAHFPEAQRDSLTIENGAGSSMYVPESCTETRKLIKQYIGDNVEYTPFDV